MKRSIITILTMASFLLDGVVQANGPDGKAADAGRFLCACDIQSQLGIGQPLMDTAIAFLKSLSLISYTKGNKAVPGDTVTLCDGHTCIDVVLTNVVTQTWTIKKHYDDDGSLYRNAKIAINKGEIGRLFAQYTVTPANLAFDSNLRIGHVTAGPLEVVPTPPPAPPSPPPPSPAPTEMTLGGFGFHFDWGGAPNNGGFEPMPTTSTNGNHY